MWKKLLGVMAGVTIILLGSGATCRQETAQSVIDTFLNTLAQNVAQELVKGTARTAARSAGPVLFSENEPCGTPGSW